MEDSVRQFYKYHWISWNSHNYERSSYSSVATLHFLNNSFYSLPTYIPPTSIENIAYPHSPSPNKLKCILDTSINRIWISKTSIVTECWISRNSHQWSTRLATKRPLTPYQVSIITNQSKQSLDEFKQQWFSQACLTPLMRYWCLHCLHSFFFIMEKEKKSIPSPLFTIAVIGKVFAILFDVHRTLSHVYGHQKLDKPHRYRTNSTTVF